jgi:tRNA-2-methylthio-N6-dimethylallyladenosine synthase
MNRKHTAEDYEALIGRVRSARPDIALSTDIIVGFPGESDADFAATMTLAGRVRFAQAFSFKYSARRGTAAATLGGQVPDSIKRERLHALQSLLDQDRHAFDRAMVGRKLKVLFEGAGRKPEQIRGRSPYLQAVHAEGPRSLIGEIVEVDIQAAGPNSLQGVINLGFAWREPVQAAV